MPPRPRPRPNAVRAPSSPIAIGGSEAGCSRKTAREEDEEEDELFIRSKGRSLREVHKRVAQAAAMAQISSTTGSDDEDEVEVEETPKLRLGRNRAQNVFNTGKVKTLPKWAKKGAIKTLLDDSDSGLENNRPRYGDTPSRKRRAGGSGAGTPSEMNGKRARTRSRSQSLTPPPDMTDLEKIRCQMAIQRALNAVTDIVPRHSSMVMVEDERDEFETGETMLDPALQHIAQAVRTRASRQTADDAFGHMHSGQEPSGHYLSTGPAVVTIRVKWVPHPDNEATYGRPRHSWLFPVKRHESLKELLLQISNKTHVLAEDLVLMCNGKQVFTSVGPEGLGFWDQGDLEACDRMTFDALRLRHFRSPTPAWQSADNSEKDRDKTAPLHETSVEPDDADKFKVVLRAADTKEITLSVRSTTTCGKIVRAFLAVVAKQSGKAPTSPRKAAQVRLCIDGEKKHSDTPISECDLEDGDMVEVVGM